MKKKKTFEYLQICNTRWIVNSSLLFNHYDFPSFLFVFRKRDLIFKQILRFFLYLVSRPRNLRIEE